MTRKEFEEVKKQSVEIAKLLSEGSLTTEERKKLEILQAQLTGLLLSPWLPFGWGRRLIMVVLFMIGAIGLAQGNVYYLFSWLFLPLFSPRLAGEITYIFGRFLTGTNNQA